MKTFKIIITTLCAGLITLSCSDDSKFKNENINPEVYDDLAIIFAGNSTEYTKDYNVNSFLKLKARIIGRNGIAEVKVGKIFDDEETTYEPVVIPEDGKIAFDLAYEAMADESYATRGFKGFTVSVKDDAGNTMEKTYSITGNIIRDPKYIKFNDFTMTLNLKGYPDVQVLGKSYFGSTSPIPIMNYEQAKQNQDKVDFILVGQVDGADPSTDAYWFGLFTPNRKSDMPLTTALFQKDFTQFPDVHMGFADWISAEHFDAVNSGEITLEYLMQECLKQSSNQAKINNKGHIWIPANGILFFRIGGGTITDFSQAFNPSIRWGFVKFTSNWGSSLAEQTALLSVIVQRPETSGLPIPQ